MKYSVRVKEGNMSLYITKVGDKYMIQNEKYQVLHVTEKQLKDIYNALNKELIKKDKSNENNCEEKGASGNEDRDSLVA